MDRVKLDRAELNAASGCEGIFVVKGNRQKRGTHAVPVGKENGLINCGNFTRSYAQIIKYVHRN